MKFTATIVVDAEGHDYDPTDVRAWVRGQHATIRLGGDRFTGAVTDTDVDTDGAAVITIRGESG